MVEMKNPIKEADANPEINHLGLWRTDLAYFWVITCDARLQDDMHYHENDDHIFMVLEGELGALPLALVLCVGLSSAAAWKRRPRD